MHDVIAHLIHGASSETDVEGGFVPTTEQDARPLLAEDLRNTLDGDRTFDNTVIFDPHDGHSCTLSALMVSRT